MQAIILAAGMGKRLGELTHENTKCMVKVHSQTLIERMLSQLARIDLKRIIIVIGYKGENVKKLIGDCYNNIPVIYVENPIYDKTNNIYSLYLAKSYLGEDDTILLESDLIFSGSILKNLLDNSFPNLVVVAKYQSWMDGTVVTLDQENNILNFIPKKAFNFHDKDDYYKTVNIYKFSKEFSTNKYIPFLRAYSQALGNNEYYEQVLRVISLLEKPELKALPIGEEKWYEIDDKQDLSNAELIFAEENEAPALYSSRFGGYWRFPELLDYCYLVNPYFPNKRMKEEMKANFEILLTEYPSGMSTNSSLAARFTNLDSEQIVVGNGAAELIQVYLRLANISTGIIHPTFEEYPNRLSPQNRIIFQPDNNSFSYNAKDIINYFDNTKIEQIIVINPDNPSGNLISYDEIIVLLSWSKAKNIRLIIDESFIDFACHKDRFTLLNKKILKENPHLVVIKSISKSYGVPGIRLGFLASGNRALIKQLKKEVSIWNINSFGEFFMQIFTKYQDSYDEACLLFEKERERFLKELSMISYLRVIPSAANYFLCEIISSYTAEVLTKSLLANANILIKNCSLKAGFTHSEYIRIAIRNTEENNKLIQALKELDI